MTSNQHGQGDCRGNCSLAAPVHLRCEYLENPLGIDADRPRLSWQLRSKYRGQEQSAYQILVASSKETLARNEGDLWDSGKVTGSQSIHVVYSGRPLISGQHCYWKVRVWDQNDIPTPYSETAEFEMGLLALSDWEGVWIQSSESQDQAAAKIQGKGQDFPAPLFRKTFELPAELVKRARAYVCGLGYFELHINGRKVGSDVLVPHWTNYDKRELSDLLYPFNDETSQRVLYLTYDVTDYLKEGRNAIGVILGNGWYNQRERTVEGKMWYGTPKLILQLNVEFADGTRQSLYTDETWTTAESPITFNNIYYGERYDARLEERGWSLSEYDDAKWSKAIGAKAPTGTLYSQTAPSDRVVKTIQPVRMMNPQEGVYVYDLGQNISGWVRLKVRGPRGTRVTLRFSEEIDETGMLDFTSCGGDNQIQTDVYVLKGQGLEEWEPRFTWHGFRYVELTGFPGRPSLDSIEGKVVHGAVQQTGSFECSNPLLNQIQTTYVWTQLTNLHGGVPSDCPHRERLGYTGDGHITAEAAMYNFNMAQFYTKWMNDISDAQNKKTGFVPHTAPFAGGGGGPGWGCACVIIPWHMYRFYGDRRILEDHYPMMSRWMEYLEGRADADCVITHEEPGSWCLGDWCTPGDIRIPREFVNTYYFGLVCKLMVFIAEVLGRPDDTARYQMLYTQIQQGMNKRFFNSDGKSYSIGEQGTEAFALAIDAVPEEKKGQVLGYLLHHLMVNRQGHLDTGIFGTPVLLDVLTEHGHADAAYILINQRDYPGYGYMIDQGATTLWETWEGKGSHNHPMFGSVSAWFYRVIGGIGIGKPGFEEVVVRPYMIEDLQYARASVDTMRGQVTSAWERQAGKVILHVSIPVNATGRIYVPKVSAAPLIEESSQVVWRENAPGCFTSGIKGCEEQERHIVFTTGSGFYTFVSR